VVNHFQKRVRLLARLVAKIELNLYRLLSVKLLLKKAVKLGVEAEVKNNDLSLKQFRLILKSLSFSKPLSCSRFRGFFNRYFLMCEEKDKPAKPYLIKLHQGWWWTCEECGRDNFERAVIQEVSEEEAEHLEELSGRPSEEILKSGVTPIPLWVNCSYEDCGHEFDTITYEDDEDDEEE
jgi:hypothetical protein